MARRIRAPGAWILFLRLPRLTPDLSDLRTPPRKSADPQAVERFQREARAASALNDPHICTIYDIGTTEAAGGIQHYIVMEMLEGETLKHEYQRFLDLWKRADPELPELAEARAALSTR